jgi:LacI family transcriptional regulator
MGRQLTIKEIAARAGVSSGTVDRVLHNRGKVSPDKEEKVRAILDEIDFKLNIHTSVISIKKNYELVICTPEYSQGEYWGAIDSGIKSALDEFNDLSIVSTHITYDQFDANSCHKAYAQILKQNPDAIILGPIFEQETRSLCQDLDNRGIPYAFVDSTIEGTNPIASLMADQPAGGRLICRLLESFTGTDNEILLCRPKQAGSEQSYNYSKRLNGFYDYVKETGRTGKVKELFFSMDDSEASAQAVISVLKQNPGIKGVAILNSRGYFIADILAEHGLKDIKVASFDLSYNNVRCLKNGSISVLLSQRPMTQGFISVRAIIEQLIYRKKEKTFIKMPIDILMKDNLPFYKDLPL